MFLREENIMFKFGTIGAFKQVRNNPRTKAEVDLVNGQVVLPNDATGLSSTPKTEDEAKGDVYVVYNIIDKPEIRNSAEFKVLAGEYVRAFRLADLVGLPVELNDEVVAVGYATLAKGDVLVPAGDGSGKWVKADGTDIVADEYQVKLEILEKTSFGGKGLYAIVK
jgi:hypothetical protein